MDSQILPPNVHPGNFRRKVKNFLIENKILYYQDTDEKRIVAQKKDLNRIWREIHLQYHAGRDKTIQMFNERYYYRGHFKWITEKVYDCVACDHKRTWLGPRTVAPLRCIPVNASNFARVHVDLSESVPDVNFFYFKTSF